MGIFRLGILAILLSDTLTSAFIVGSAFHVFTSQVLSLLGLKKIVLSPDSVLGKIPFELVQIYGDLFTRITQVNLATITVSLVVITVLVLIKRFLEPFLIKKYELKNFTIPIDIVMVSLGVEACPQPIHHSFHTDHHHNHCFRSNQVGTELSCRSYTKD